MVSGHGVSFLLMWWSEAMTKYTNCIWMSLGVLAMVVDLHDLVLVWSIYRAY